MRAPHSRSGADDRTTGRACWLAAGLALLGSLAAVLGALWSGPAFARDATAHAAPGAVAALGALGGVFGLLGCIGAGITLVWRGVGTAILLAAAAGLAVTGFAVPAGLALLLGAVLMPIERA